MINPQVGERWYHIKTGNVYVVQAVSIMEHPQTEVWESCVSYGGAPYVRSLVRFLERFAKVEEQG